MRGKLMELTVTCYKAVNKCYKAVNTCYKAVNKCYKAVDKCYKSVDNFCMSYKMCRSHTIRSWIPARANFKE